MFPYKYLFALLAICRLTNCQDKVTFFRKDYVYLSETDSYYKIHTMQKTWEEAKERCSLEGASLFYPVDDDEVEVVVKHWNDTQPFVWVFIGISTPNAKEVFETVDGLTIERVYDRWGPGEPNNAGGVEGCVILRRDGTLNDENCEKSFPFICKKSRKTLVYNPYCDMPDLGYTYSEKLEKCYKFHSTPKNWTEAYTVCSVELSNLAIINSQEEANFMVDLTEKAREDRLSGIKKYMPGAVYLGFRRKDGDWKTTNSDMSLEDSGYTEWGVGQPDGGELENCGSMFYNAKLNDIACDKELFFICEHEIDLLQSAIILRTNILVAWPIIRLCLAQVLVFLFIVRK